MPVPMSDGPGTKKTPNPGNPPGPTTRDPLTVPKAPAGSGDQDAKGGGAGSALRQGHAVPTGIAYRDHPRPVSTDGGPVTPAGAARD